MWLTLCRSLSAHDMHWKFPPALQNPARCPLPPARCPPPLLAACYPCLRESISMPIQTHPMHVLIQPSSTLRSSFGGMSDCSRACHCSKVTDAWSWGTPVVTTMIGAEGLTQAVPTTPREWAEYFHHSHCHATSPLSGAGVAATISDRSAPLPGPRGAGFESVTCIEGLHRCPRPPLAGAWESWALTDLGYALPECGDLGGPWGGAYSALSDAALVQDMQRLYTNEAVWHTCQANGYKLLRQLCDPDDLDQLQVGASWHRLRTCNGPCILHDTCAKPRSYPPCVLHTHRLCPSCVVHTHPAYTSSHSLHHTSKCDHPDTLYRTALSDSQSGHYTHVPASIPHSRPLTARSGSPRRTHQ